MEKVLVGAKIKTVPISIVGFAEQAPFELVVIGSDLDSVMTYAEGILDRLRKIPGTSESKLSVEGGTPEIAVEVNRDKMAALGLNLQTVGATMQTAFNGNTDGKFRSGEYEYDINIRFDDYDRKNVEDVSHLLFRSEEHKYELQSLK